MKKGSLMLLLYLTTMLLALPLVGAAASPDEDAIRGRAEEFVAAWNEHDTKAMALLWTAEGDFIDPFGKAARGRHEVEKLFAEDHDGVMKGTTYSLTIEQIDMVHPDVAILTWHGKVTGMKMPDGSAMPPLDHIVTAVTVREEGKWWTASVRAMVPVPMAVPPPPPPAADK